MTFEGMAETFHERHLNQSKTGAGRPMKQATEEGRCALSLQEFFSFASPTLRSSRAPANRPKSALPFCFTEEWREFSRERFKRLLKYPRMPRCSQFSEDRQEPSEDLMGCGAPISPQCRSAPRKLGDKARAENWRNPEGVSSLGHHGSVREPFLTGVLPQSQPAQGMLLRSSIDICPKEIARGLRGYFNSLLKVCAMPVTRKRKTRLADDDLPGSARLDGGRSGIRH